MMKITLYNRDNCSLCDQAIADLKDLQEHYPHNIDIINVDHHPKLKKEYGDMIPVVEIGPYILKAPFSVQTLQMTLAAAQDRIEHIEKIDSSPMPNGSRSSYTWNGADRFTYWISHHYMLLFNSFVAIYLGLALLAPIFMKTGFLTPASIIYRLYNHMCHQLAYRSIFIFGEQPFYPRTAAGVDGYLTYGQATGLSEGNSYDEVMTARDYRGSETLGYKLALCQRDLAIYGGILLFGLLFALSGNNFPVIPWYIWLLIGIIPIGLDGLSQLLSQPPLNFFPYRESTPALRIITGSLFGFFTAWFGYPLVEETMLDTRQIMRAKWERTHRETR